MLNTGVSYFAFLVPKLDFSQDARVIAQAFENLSLLSEDTKKALGGMPLSFANVIPIPETFVEFMQASIILEHSISELIQAVHNYPEKNARIIVLTPESFKDLLNKFEDNLKHTQKKLVHNLNEVSTTFLKIKEIQENLQK